MLDIRYCEVDFRIKFLEETILPKYKNSMLIGALVNKLMYLYCINNKECGKCNIKNNCIIQILMGFNFTGNRPLVEQCKDIFPNFILVCNSSKTKYYKETSLEFRILFLGKATNFISQFIYAFDTLGSEGIGKSKSKYILEGVYNDAGIPIYEKGYFYDNKIQTNSLIQYIESRKSKIKMGKGLYLKTPFNFRGNIIDFNLESIFIAIFNRLEGLNIISDEDRQKLKKLLRLNLIENFKVNIINRKYLINREERYIQIIGFKGRIGFNEAINEYLDYILACEKIHVGSNILLGFGNFNVKEE